MEQDVRFLRYEYEHGDDKRIDFRHPGVCHVDRDHRSARSDADLPFARFEVSHRGATEAGLEDRQRLLTSHHHLRPFWSIHLGLSQDLTSCFAGGGWIAASTRGA